MTPLHLASGNLLADRRADYAEMLFREGDPAAAAEILVGALELAPDWAAGWFRAGEMHEAAGQKDASIAAWHMAARLDPADRMGAALKLELAGVARGDSGAPAAFVETLFDQYAETFDKALVDTLGYRAPELLLDAIVKARPARFAKAVDLGCGTGLMGVLLRPHCDRLSGYDISAGMLRKAEARGFYDELVKADLNRLVLPKGSADLVVAADVFLYLGRLERIVATAAVALRPGGLLAFTVEKQDGPEDVILRGSRRYAHSEGYVGRVLSEAGLTEVRMEEATLRKDRDEAIAGLIVVCGLK